MRNSQRIGLALLLAAVGAPFLVPAGTPPELPHFELEMMTSSKRVIAEPVDDAAAPEPAPAAVDIRMAGVEPPATDRARIVTGLQRELARVGCYAGPLDGQWSGATQVAMRAFAIRVGALVPMDEPSHILQTLVEGFKGAACTGTCPGGRSRGADGRCVEVVRTAEPAAAAKPAVLATPPVRVINAPQPAGGVPAARSAGAVAAVAKPPAARAAGRAARAAGLPVDPRPGAARPVYPSLIWSQPSPVARPSAGSMVAGYAARP